MIFNGKGNYEKVLSGDKTETRRIIKPNEMAFADDWGFNIGAVSVGNGESIPASSNLRTKWEVGRTYAALPKRGVPAHWFMWHFGDLERFTNPIEAAYTVLPDRPQLTVAQANKILLKHGAAQARIEIVSIHSENLQDISNESAIAEGVASIEEYRDLWQSINTRPGTRWDDNPKIWVIRFKSVVKDLYQIWQSQGVSHDPH